MRALGSVIAASMFFLAACQPAGKDSASETLATTSAPLPITGVWHATDVWGFEESKGVRRAVRASANELKNGLWNVKIEIDSKGSGLLQGLVNCSGAANIAATPNRVYSSSVLNTIFGLLSLPELLKSTIDGVECAKSPSGAISSFVSVRPSNDFLGRRSHSLSKNLGVFGEGKSSHAADSECRKLRGVRFVNISNSSACVGFTDSKANKIRFLIVPDGEIYATRINMTRD